MGDEDGGHARALLYAANLLAHFQAQAGVEVGKGLVEQKQAGVLHQRPGDGHALLLAAGELGGMALHHRIHVDELGDIHGALEALGLGHLLHFQREADVLQHRHVRVERVILEHQADAALFRGHVGHVVVVEVDLAARDRQDARQHVEDGGLAAARRAEQGDQFPMLQRGGEIRYRRDVAEFLGQVFEPYSHARRPFSTFVGVQTRSSVSALPSTSGISKPSMRAMVGASSTMQARWMAAPGLTAGPAQKNVVR